MCMNCGCHKPHDVHDHPVNITVEDLQRAAAANGQTLRQTVVNIVATLDTYEREAAAGREGVAQSTGATSEPAASRGTPETES